MQMLLRGLNEVFLLTSAVAGKREGKATLFFTFTFIHAHTILKRIGNLPIGLNNC